MFGVLFAAYATVPGLFTAGGRIQLQSEKAAEQMELPRYGCICILLSMFTSLLAKSALKPFYSRTDFSLRALILFR